MNLRIISTNVIFLIVFLLPSTTLSQSAFDTPSGAARTQHEEADQPSNGSATPAPQSSPQTSAGDDEWSRTMEEYGDVLSQLNSQGAECLAIMVLYVYEWVNLLERTDAEANCKMKYDLYGMQLLMMASSTTVLHCPERLSAYSDEELDAVYDDYMKMLGENTSEFTHQNLYADLIGQHGEGMQEETWHRYGPWPRLWFRTEFLRQYHDTDGIRLGLVPEPAEAEAEGESEEAAEDRAADRTEALYGAGFIRVLAGYFDPSYLVPRTFTVGMTMAGMNCAASAGSGAP